MEPTTRRGDRQPPSEFLPGPAWRTRASRPVLGLAVGVTFAAVIALGWAVLLALMWVMRELDAPGRLVPLVWIVPTVGAVVWALWRPSPATASQDEAQPWSDYAVLAVMIGVEGIRPAPHRVLTAVLFGAPLVMYLTITLVLEALGLF